MALDEKIVLALDHTLERYMPNEIQEITANVCDLTGMSFDNARAIVKSVVIRLVLKEKIILKSVDKE